MKRKNLIKLLVDYDIKQCDVAEYLEVTDQHFSLLVNGNANPSFGLIEKFEEFCNERGIVIDDMWEVWKME